MLLVQTDRDTLLKPLQAVTGIVERRHTLPILSNVLMERSEDRLSFLATDLEIQVSTWTPCKGEGTPQVVTVAAKKLQDILRALAEDQTVALDTASSRLQVKAGKSRFNLQTLPAEDFPRLAESTVAGGRVTMTQGAFKRLLHLVQYSMAQQDIRYYLNGLLVVMEAGSLKVVATDGHRLAYAAAEQGMEGDRQEVILPRKAVIELSKLLTDGDDPLLIEILQNQVRFTFGNVVLVSKVVDGKFPDFGRVIPTNYQKHFPIGRIPLLHALQRAAILSNEKFRGVRFVLTEDSLRTVCSNTEQEEAQEELEIEYKGEPLDIGFNINYLMDVLNNVGTETVDCAFGDANSSVLITVPGNDQFKYVVMPMRI